jgi:hypothetical protein
MNKRKFGASSWRSNQGYSKMDGQPTIILITLTISQCVREGEIFKTNSFESLNFVREIVCAICVSVGIRTYIHTYIHTYTPLPIYILNIHTCVVYVHRGLYISVWLHARYANENCALLCYFAASSGNFLPTFRDSYRSHPQGSRIPPPPKKTKQKQKSAVLSYFVAEALKPRTLRT